MTPRQYFAQYLPRWQSVPSQESKVQEQNHIPRAISELNV